VKRAGFVEHSQLAEAVPARLSPSVLRQGARGRCQGIR
jgi:hypothetical protein